MLFVKEDMVQIFVMSGRLVFRQEEEEEEEEKVSAFKYSNEVYPQEESALISKVEGEGSEINSTADEVIDRIKVNGSESNEVNFGPSRPAEAFNETSFDVDMDGCASHATSGSAHDMIDDIAMQSQGDMALPIYNRPAKKKRQWDQPRVQSPFASRTVAELKGLARQLGIDISDCIEKREIMDKLAQRVSQGPSRP